MSENTITHRRSIICTCGSPMTMSSIEAQRNREFTCERYGQPGYDTCAPPISEERAAARRIGPFASSPPQHEPRTWTESMHAPTALEAVRPDLFRRRP